MKTENQKVKETQQAAEPINTDMSEVEKVDDLIFYLQAYKSSLATWNLTVEEACDPKMQKYAAYLQDNMVKNCPDFLKYAIILDEEDRIEKEW